VTCEIHRERILIGRINFKHEDANEHEDADDYNFAL
jgi:hypothetical protein